MHYVYLLTHRRCVEHNEKDGDIYDTKVLGVYITARKAQEAIAFFSGKVGFQDYKNDFYIQKRKILGNRHIAIKSVFLVEYERFLYDDVYCKHFLGICSDEQTANKVINIAKQKSRYDKTLEEYEVIEYDLDSHSAYWAEGFS